MNRDKLNQYLDSRIKFYEEQLKMSKDLGENNILKEYCTTSEKSALDTFKEIKEFVNSDLSLQGTITKEDNKCLDKECSFCEDNICTYGGLMYEKPCYENKGYFEDWEE